MFAICDIISTDKVAEPKNDAAAIFTLAFHIRNLKMKNRHIGITTLQNACLRHSLPGRLLCPSAPLVHSVYITRFTPPPHSRTLSILPHLLSNVLCFFRARTPLSSCMKHRIAGFGCCSAQCRRDGSRGARLFCLTITEEWCILIPSPSYRHKSEAF